MAQVNYDLYGTITVSYWGGGEGVANLHIKTDEEGLSNIKKEPRQDYLSFGVKSINYVDFTVYKSEIYEDKNAVIKTRFKNPVEEITSGTISKEAEDLICTHLEEIEYVEIDY